MRAPYLSKSKYLIGLQCHTLLWTHYNAKEQLPPVDEQTQAVLDQGHHVGMLAQQLFPGGITVTGDLPLAEAISTSRRVLEARKPVFEAAFDFNRTFARADILVPVRGGKWDIIEVKSSTSVREPYWEDVAFQRYCYEGAGVPIRRCYLMHINSDYVRHGNVDPARLFAREDITEGVTETSVGIEARVRRMLRVIGSRKTPKTGIGPHCSDPYDCPLASSCWKEVNRVRNNVFSLTRLGEKAWGLYRAGVVKSSQISSDFRLSEAQKIQIEAERTRVPHFDGVVVSEFLQQLAYPLYLLDFETFQTAIPVVDGTRPYQQVPFQFSLHVASSLQSRLHHHSWLWDGKGDPRRILLARLLPLLGKVGSIVAYNAGFEMARLRECGEADHRFSVRLDEVLARFVDLYAPFRSFAVYHPAQHGSASIKSVLPALSGKSYESLAIHDGGQASEEFARVTFGEVSEEERQEVRQDLERYCALDTMAMRDIVRQLALLSKRT